jgi:hypothetical protein
MRASAFDRESSQRRWTVELKLENVNVNQEAILHFADTCGRLERNARKRARRKARGK